MNGFQVRHISWKFALFLGLLSLFGHAEAAQVDQIPMAHEIGSYLAKGSRAAWDEVLRDYPSAKFRNVHAFLSQNDEAHEIFEEIKHFHFSIIDELFQGKHHPVYDDVANTFVEIDWLIEDEPDNNPDYIYDQIVSIGEVVSTKIVAAWLNEMGNKTLWVDARNYIQTDNTYKEGKVDWTKTNQVIQFLLLSSCYNGSYTNILLIAIAMEKDLNNSKYRHKEGGTLLLT